MKYHTDIYMPEEAKRLEFATMLRYSQHAKNAAKDDRYGQIDLPKVFDSRKATLIEAVVESGKVVKALYRMDYDTLHDLCLVIATAHDRVLTVWLNRKDDEHHTLDRSQYARG